MLGNVQCREYIITSLLRGKGTKEEPFRKITEVWVINEDGSTDKIAEYDPFKMESI